MKLSLKRLGDIHHVVSDSDVICCISELYLNMGAFIELHFNFIWMNNLFKRPHVLL